MKRQRELGIRRGMQGSVCAIVGVALAGCGSGNQLSKAEYRSHLARDYKAIESAAAALNTITPSESLRARLKQVDESKRFGSAALTDLSSIKPPSDAAHDNATIVKAVRLLLAGLERVTKDTAAGKYSSLRGPLSCWVDRPVSRTATAAERDLRAKGTLSIAEPRMLTHEDAHLRRHRRPALSPRGRNALAARSAAAHADALRLSAVRPRRPRRAYLYEFCRSRRSCARPLGLGVSTPAAIIDFFAADKAHVQQILTCAAC